MRNTIVIAIDPGAKGALAALLPDGSVEVYPFTGTGDAVGELRALKHMADAERWDIFAALERVGGFVGKNQPGSAMFNFGANYGAWLGALMALQIPVRLVAPSVWQKAFPTRTSAAKNKAAHKRELKEHAARLFPRVKCTLANADALLMLDYAARHSAD